MMIDRLRIALYSPDRARYYDGRTPEAEGVGGGITARLSMAEALAAIGHDVTAYVHCRAPLQHRGVAYVPIDGPPPIDRIDCDIFIAISTGGALTFAPLRAIDVTASLRIVWVQGVPRPADLDAVAADYVYVASNFLREVCVTRWQVPERQIFVGYNGIHQEYFEIVETHVPPRDPFAMAYVGPPEKGLDACVGVLRRLRAVDDRFHLDVFGGAPLWGRPADPQPNEPGLRHMGLMGQRQLAAALFTYEYCLALQAMEEGFGIAVQEAKRAGVIVVASRVGAFSELIEHRQNGYLIAGPHDSPGPQAEAASLILGLADDPSRRDRIRRRARATPWSWERTARRWLAHWESVLAKGEPPPVTETIPRGSRHLLIAGYYGHGNLGDEAILSGILDECQRALPDLIPIVTSGDPPRTSAQHDVAAVDDRDVPALEQAAGRSALLVMGGGGPFHDHYGVDETTLLTGAAWGLTSCVMWPVLARAAATPLMVMAAGVGPLRSAAGQRLTRLVFEQADASTVRDQESRALLDAIGVNAARIGVCADPAFLLRSADATLVRTHLRRMGVADEAPLVVVALRHWDLGPDGRHWESSVAGALDLLVDQSPAAILFVPFQSRAGEPDTDDVVVAKRVRKLMRHQNRVALGDPDLSPSLVQGIFEASDLVLAMRLHAVILAANARTPFVALRYDDKVGHTVTSLGLESCAADLSTITPTSLFQRMASARTDRDRVRTTLDERLPAMREAARQNVQAAVDLLQRGPAPPAASAEWTTLFDRAQIAMQAGRAARAAGNRRPLGDLGRSIARRVIPAPWRRVLRETWHRRLMSPSAFVFDRYKRRRIREYGADLAGVRAPGEPGLITVVLPAFNGGAMIREAIDSVLGQSYATLELIIIDDGSTDGTGAIADEYARLDARVRVVHQANQTLPVALSRGVQLAQGEFLTWTSCDNRLKPFCLQKLMDCLRRHPHWDMVYGNLDLIGADGQPLTRSPNYASYQVPHGSQHVRLPQTSTELNTRLNNFIGAGFLYRSRVAALLGDYSRFRFGLEDYDYWMRVNALMTLRHADFDDPVVDYRFHGGSLTARAEALGLPAKSRRLMVFDQFRRDACLSPMVWVFAARSTPMARSLEQRARQAGHLIYEDTYALGTLPPCWTPIVYVDTADRTAPPSIGRGHLPAGIVTVLIASAAEAPPESADADAWHLRIALGTTAGPADRAWPGWLMAPDVDRLFHAIDIRVKSLAVAAVEALAEAPPTAELKASVIICTFSASDRLAAAIDSVLAQDYPRDRFELIVVNNNPADRELAEELNRRTGTLTIVVCPIPGHSAAKNAGIAAARGEYVCFLDDDAVAERPWLSRLCRAFDEHPEAGVVGGPILLKSPEPRPAALIPGWETYWSHFTTQFTEYTTVDTWGAFPWGANWAARRTALALVGGFRTSFGRTRTDFAGGEELFAAALAQRLGFTVAIVPDAIVHHHVDPRRFTATDVRHTMAVRHVLAHAAKRDLLVPGAQGLSTTVARLALHHVDPRVRSWRQVLRDVGYRKAAQFNLLKVQLAELRDRRRRPVQESS